jgi:hypothetical protein
MANSSIEPFLVAVGGGDPAERPWFDPRMIAPLWLLMSQKSTLPRRRRWEHLSPRPHKRFVGIIYKIDIQRQLSLRRRPPAIARLIRFRHEGNAGMGISTVTAMKTRRVAEPQRRRERLPFSRQSQKGNATKMAEKLRR